MSDKNSNLDKMIVSHKAYIAYSAFNVPVFYNKLNIL